MIRSFGAGLCMLLISGCGITPAHKSRQIRYPSAAVKQERIAEPENERGEAVRGADMKRIFVVIDDAGLTLNETVRYLKLPMPLTVAVLPHQKDTREVVAAIKHSDKELMLHQPMEARGGNDPGLAAIFNDTPPEAVPLILRENLASVDGALGMNNHMGSLVTENEVLLRKILSYCKEHGLFFLDSKTAYNSHVKSVAEQLGITVYERTDFLDIKHDRESIQRAWEGAVARADRTGMAIVIGHAWSEETAKVLAADYQSLLDRGFTFHLVSELYE